VFREGESGDKMYVLVSGSVEIRQTRNGAEKVLVQMKPGDCFGEMAIIDSGPRSADAFAVTPCMVMEVKAETIHQDDDPIALKMVRQLAVLLTQKIRRMSQ
jgi:CRP-like cAMP-binding protein